MVKHYPILELLSEKYYSKIFRRIPAFLRAGHARARLKEMADSVSGARQETLPSKYWEKLNEFHFHFLKAYGYENFKRTVALYFFTWTMHAENQIEYLKRHLTPDSVERQMSLAKRAKSHDFFGPEQSLVYNLLTYLLWEYVSRIDNQNLLESFCEPREGNPPRILLDGKLISQDIANSILEYKSMMDSGIVPAKIRTVIELGAGYGRTAYVFLKLLPGLKYYIADISPALYVAERYLSNQFPEKKIFRFRKFSHYSEIEEELAQSEIAFFTPNQLEVLPDRMADLFVNISSLHEMRLDQIQYYCSQIERLVKSYVYLKQSKISPISGENIEIKERDYPIPKRWSQMYWRECRVQTGFFEALFSVG